MKSTPVRERHHTTPGGTYLRRASAARALLGCSGPEPDAAMETEGRPPGPPPVGQLSRLEARLVLEAALEARFPRLCIKKPIIGGNTLGARGTGRQCVRGEFQRRLT